MRGRLTRPVVADVRSAALATLARNHRTGTSGSHRRYAAPASCIASTRTPQVAQPTRWRASQSALVASSSSPSCASASSGSAVSHSADAAGIDTSAP